MSKDDATPEMKPPEEAEIKSSEVTQETKEATEPPEKVEEIEEEIEIVEEKFFTISLRDAWKSPKDKRAPKAIKIVRGFVKRHMKVDNIKISDRINQEIWTRSIQKPPRRIKIRAVKDKEGQVIVFPVKSA